MEDNHQQYETDNVYHQLKRLPSERLTPDELSEAIKRDIRCVGLIPEGMQIEGMPNLSKQEIEDIRFICSENWSDIDDDDYMLNKFDMLPQERRTKAVSQAAVLNDAWNIKWIPKNILTDDLILFALRKDGSALGHVSNERRTKEMFLTALENRGKALVHFPTEMITAEIAMKAVKQDGLAIEFVPETVRTPEVCRAALSSDRKDYEVIQFVPFPDVCMEHLKKITTVRFSVYYVFCNAHY
jgi:hypothetical protein